MWDINLQATNERDKQTKPRGHGQWTSGYQKGGGGGKLKHEMLKKNKVLKRRTLPPRIIYQTRLSFKTEGEIKCLLEKQKLKDFITIKPT